MEEQFYLLWPMVVLMAPARRLTGIAAALVVFSFGYEVVGALRGRTFEETHLVLQGCMDALGLGALLAIRSPRDGGGRGSAERLSFWAALLGAPLFFFAQGFRYQVGIPATDMLPYRIPGDLGIALMSVALVYLATTTGPSAIRRVLELAPVRYVGRISYGIYLYHLFLIPIGRAAARQYGVPELGRGVRMFLIYGVVSVLLATVSWYLIESPINRQKRRFPFPPRPVGPPPPGPGDSPKL